MSSPSTEPIPEFHVGPDADPDRYVLGTAVSSGAEGILYRGSITTATGVQLDVAIKMLQPRLLCRVEEWHARWSEQVELLRSLQVPGVVPVRDGFLGPLPHPPQHVPDARTLYLVMNWVDGESLDEWIAHRPDRDPIGDLKVLLPVAAALDLMHSGHATGGVPIVHRDIKPSNIIVTDHGSVLVDFGLTRGLPSGERLTGVVGTPGYLAPETGAAGVYSVATDCYAFGATAYFVVTGEEPPVTHQPETLAAEIERVAGIAHRPDVIDHLTEMLATDPESRPDGLANWIGQLRRSSIGPEPDMLKPAAPRRFPSSDPPKRRRSKGPRTRVARPQPVGRRRFKPTAAVVLGVLGVILGLAALVVGLELRAMSHGSPLIFDVSQTAVRHSAGGTHVDAADKAQSPLSAHDVKLTVHGQEFGAQEAYVGDRPCIELIDRTRGWEGGHAIAVGASQRGGAACDASLKTGDDVRDAVTLQVAKWSDSAIEITGLQGHYGQTYDGVRCLMYPNDKLTILVWSAQSGRGPARASVAVAG